MTERSLRLWYLYVVRTAHNQLYTGISTDPNRRLRQHSGELAGGAKALRGKGPLALMYQHAFPDRSSASAAEYRFKQLSKAQKEAVVRLQTWPEASTGKMA